MFSLHHGAIFLGVFLIVTGGSTAFLASYQSRLQAFSLCCVVLGAIMLILGMFWAMNSKSPANYNGEYNGQCSHYPFEEYPQFGSQVHFTPPAHRIPESQSVFIPRNPVRQQCGAHGEELDYPPMDPGCFSPSANPPPWLGPPPPYEVAIKTTCSSTHLRRAYSDSQLASEPLFGRSREISFEV
ncbi:uncharacterized protein FYW47_008642 [Aplochiton taeniatus]